MFVFSAAFSTLSFDGLTMTEKTPKYWKKNLCQWLYAQQKWHVNYRCMETDLRDEKPASSWKWFAELMTKNEILLHANTQILSCLFSLLFLVVKCAIAELKCIICSSHSNSGYNSDQQDHTHTLSLSLRHRHTKTHTHIYIYIYMHVIAKQLFIYRNVALITYSHKMVSLNKVISLLQCNLFRHA
jgi:hypothetical protein